MPASVAHPAKMLPAIARHAIATYTAPGELVLDPMAGIGTTIVEAMHLGRDGYGIECERRWTDLAAANIRNARGQGATGAGVAIRGDGRHLLELLPNDLRGRVALVLTSPPYGPSTHGQVREWAGPGGRVKCVNSQYGEDAGNLAYRRPDALAAGFTGILTGCAALLRPGGHVVVTARPYRRQGELVDIPGMVAAAGNAAGLVLIDRCVALIAGIRNGRLVPRGSFFQLRNVRLARASGDPQWLINHEDVLIFQRRRSDERAERP